MALTFDDPVTLYRGTETKVVMNKKAWDKAKEEGFGSYNAAQNEYKKAMYHPRREDMKFVNNREEEDALVAKGWRTKPFAEGEETAKEAECLQAPRMAAPFQKAKG